MAQKIETFLIDDLDGSEAAGTIQFGLDGAKYEIDLSPRHASELQHALAPYIEAGRKTGPQRRPRKPPAGNPDTAQVRTWARARGIEINDRGRIPAGILTQYQEATK